MKLLAPVVITVALSWFLYGQKLVFGKEQYDLGVSFLKWVNARNEQLKKQGEARVNVVEQFQQQSAYGPDLGRMEAASQYTIIKT